MSGQATSGALRADTHHVVYGLCVGSRTQEQDVSIPPAWHPDPTGRHDHRWWDGTRWTEHVADAGVASVDPVEGPAPASGGDAAAGPDTTGGAFAGGEPGTGPDTPASGGAATVGPGETSGGVGSGWTSPQGEQAPPAGATEPAAPGAGGGAWGTGTPAQQAGGWSSQQPAAGGGYDWNAAQQPAPTGSDGMAVTAMILGLLAVAISWIPFLGLLGAVAGVVAIVLGPIAMKRIKRSGRGGRGMAITGLVTGIVSVVLAIVMTVFAFTLFRGIGWGPFQEYAECMEEVGDEDFCEEQLEREIERRFFGGN
jgi:hypothetical protein